MNPEAISNVKYHKSTMTVVPSQRTLSLAGRWEASMWDGILCGVALCDVIRGMDVYGIVSGDTVVWHYLRYYSVMWPCVGSYYVQWQ